MRYLSLSIASITLIAGIAANVQAQKVEIHPYAGAFLPGKFAGLLEMKNSGIYGVEGGTYVMGGLEAEGHFGFINDLSFVDTLSRKRSYVWEGLASYNFQLFHWQPRFYGAIGVGSLRTAVSDDSKSFWGSSIATADSFVSL